jgi:hypothetical protein
VRRRRRRQGEIDGGVKLQIGSPSLSIEVVRVSRQRDGRGRRGWWSGVDAGSVADLLNFFSLISFFVAELAARQS